jgi:uncharacterized protein
MRYVIALLAFLTLLPATQAASFDCNKAATPIEKAICADPALSHADDVMALVYVWPPNRTLSRVADAG